MARKWLRISLSISVSMSLCWQVAAASNNTFSRACLWACVCALSHAVCAAKCVNPQPLPVGRIRSGQPVGNLQELTSREKISQKIPNNTGNRAVEGWGL